MTCRFTFPLASLLALSAASASAGTLANGTWAPAACGPAPVAANLDLRNLDAYNSSVEKVNIYHKSNDVYLSCLIKEANADIQLITQTAKAAQQAADDTDVQIKEEAKAAGKKFGN